MWEILAVAFLVAIMVSLLAPRLFRRGPGANSLSGTLLITGVSPKPDATGEQYVTITGVIDGPNVTDFTVYQRTIANVERWPAVGELRPVVYSERNPEKWAFAPRTPTERPSAERPESPPDPPAE